MLMLGFVCFYIDPYFLNSLPAAILNVIDKEREKRGKKLFSFIFFVLVVGKCGFHPMLPKLGCGHQIRVCVQKLDSHILLIIRYGDSAKMCLKR